MARRHRPNRSAEFRFVLEIDPPPIELAAMYNGVADALIDIRPALKRLAPDLSRAMRVNIDNEGSALGGDWPKPNPVYARRKELDNYGSKPLVRKGQLRREVGKVLRITKSSLAIGLTGKLAKRGAQLQFKRGYVFMGWTPSMQRLAVDHIDKYIEVSIANAMNAYGASRTGTAAA